MTRVEARGRCAVITCMSPSQPGFLDFAYRVHALAASHHVTLISNIDLDIAEFRVAHVQHVQVPMPEGQWGWLRFLARCAALLRAGHFDRVMLLHSAVAPLAMACRAMHLPVVLYWNEHPTHLAPPCGWSQPLSKVIRGLVRRLMFAGARAADLVMPIGEAHHQDLLAHGVRAQCAQLVPMGVASAFRAEHSRGARRSDEPLQLIYIGTVAADRGRDVMFEAMAQVQAQSHLRGRAHLTIVGVQPDQMAECQGRVERLGLQGSVSLVGRVPGHDIPSLLQRAHVGLCLWEDRVWYRFNPPTKLFEYLVAGLPVLASNIRTHTAYVRDGVNGFIFDYSPHGLATAIARILSSDLDWQAINFSAWAAGEPYLWSTIQPRFLQAFSQAGR
ncbi:MAG: hypothetical protein RLZZ182_2655 [Pseudomonadota bacterium]